MAFITESDRPRALRNSLYRLRSAIWAMLITHVERCSRRDQIDWLNALSDDELAERGIERDQIIAHVFRDRLLAF